MSVRSYKSDMAADLVIGLDLGTTTCKAIAVARDGSVIASASSGTMLHVPEPGAAEIDADEAWAMVCATLRELARTIDASRFEAISLSTAMHTLLCVDHAGRPLAPVPTWADTRSADDGKILRRSCDTALLARRTGCPVRWMYHPARMRWLTRVRPEVARKAARIVTLKDWVIWRLTGTWATDLSLASTTGWLDIATRAWDAESLALSGVDESRLPALVSPKAIVGKIGGAASGETGLPRSLRVVAGASDGPLANLGAAGDMPGRLVMTVGTSGAARTIVDAPAGDDREKTWCYILTDKPARWVVGGAINNGGLLLDWVRRRFYEREGERAFEAMERDAVGVPAGAEGVTVIPYLTGERCPVWDPGATGALHGLSLRHTRAHVTRAAMEAVAFCLAEVRAALTVPGGDEPAMLTGGITRSPTWCAIVADTLGAQVSASEAGDASAIGAAALAWRALDTGGAGDAMKHAAGRVYEPGAAHAVYREVFARWRAIRDTASDGVPSLGNRE